jgi:hypothetical protein
LYGYVTLKELKVITLSYDLDKTFETYNTFNSIGNRSYGGVNSAFPRGGERACKNYRSYGEKRESKNYRSQVEKRASKNYRSEVEKRKRG